MLERKANGIVERDAHGPNLHGAGLWGSGWRRRRGRWWLHDRSRRTLLALRGALLARCGCRRGKQNRDQKRSFPQVKTPRAPLSRGVQRLCLENEGVKAALRDGRGSRGDVAKDYNRN